MRKKILNFKDFAILEAIYLDEIKNSEINKKALLKVKACIFFLTGKYPFFSSLLGALMIRENRRLRYKTMATDGLSIHYDPDFVMSLSEPEIQFVLAHEVMHCVLQHFIRCPKNETMAGTWNVACDYALNQMIAPPIQSGGKIEVDVKDTIGKMPKDCLYPGCGHHKNDERFLNMTAEQIYNILIREGYKPDVPPKDEKRDPPPPPKPPIDPKVGDVIYDSANSTYGVVTSYDNKSGEVQYDPIPIEKVREFASKSSGGYSI
jgi:hypothetical protein